MERFLKKFTHFRTQIPYDLSPLLPYDVQNFRIDAPYGHKQHIKISEPEIEQKIASEVKTRARACAPAHLSDHHQKLIRDAPYGGEHA